MTTLFKKLNVKDQSLIHVVDAPESFLSELDAISAYTKVESEWKGNPKSGFILAFCTKQTEVDSFAQKADAMLEGDGLLWIAYPKGTSKKYTCDFNRDTGWATLGKLGFEPIRQVAIDEDWSALRFRKVRYIKKMTRRFAITAEGKNKTGTP